MESNLFSPELGALALAKSLLPHIENVEDLDEFLLFPPDLFAFTSLILSVTGAYRLIVSPPKASDQNSTRELWMPTEDENMRDFSEFNEDSIDDFKDVRQLVERIFKSKDDRFKDDRISKVVLNGIDGKEIEEVVNLYEKVRDKNEEDEASTFFELEKRISSIFNRVIEDGSLYEKTRKQHPDEKDIFIDAKLSDEFWDILRELDEVKNTFDERIIDRQEYTKRLNRLFLEGFYPDAIKESLPWNKRVRTTGLAWRKNLGKTFLAEDFEQLKNRKDIDDLEELIDNLECLEEIVRKRDELRGATGKIKNERFSKLNSSIENIKRETGLEVNQINAETKAKIINEKRRERDDRICERRKLISARIQNEDFVPKVLRRYWENFKEGVSSVKDGKIREILCESSDEEKRSDHWQRFVSIVSLHAIADEACAGWGIRGPLKFLKEGLMGTVTSATQRYAEDLLDRYGSLSTISKDRCRVLPKRHTAEVGITLRSISCNLGFHRSSVEVKWGMGHKGTKVFDKELKSLNVLLLPIPLEIHTTDFSRRKVPVKSHQNSQDFFEYNPDVFGVRMMHGENPKFSNQPDSEKNKFKERIKKILVKAREEVGEVHMAVLPETAIHEKAVPVFEEALLSDAENPVKSYIAGVRESGERFNRNAVYFKVAKKENDSETWKFSKGAKDSKDAKEFTQYKHHRWKLDRSQIIQYQLGGALSPTKSWWEAIKIGDREVNFINIGELLTVCPLICEDLARQDPISDLIRTVGPTLVVAILMDGPQLLRRWAGKYASVLGDDPGSAVITLTSYGMVKRSLVHGHEPSRIIALWSSPDAKTEIDLEEGAEAVLLSLSIDERKEKSSDGREEMSGTPSLSLAGIRQIRLTDSEKPDKILRC